MLPKLLWDIAQGFNFRMPSICAALGLAQLEKLDELIQARRERAAMYNSLLGGLSDVDTPVEPSRVNHVYQMYAILVKGGRVRRGALQD